MLTMKVTEGLDIPLGWQTMTIAKAVDGDYNGTRYIDLHFTGLPESVKCRIWSATNKDTGEDFGIGNLFYYANAGLTLEDGSLSIDDNANHLKSKNLQVYFYIKDNGYTEAAQRVAPVVREGFSESHVEKLKMKAEKWVKDRTEAVTTETEAAPF